ncbi:MAG: GPR endopeptidase [Clostridia bacterium]|nr:GPR endopeptidase [Clostridia bacterium]
MPFNPRTDLALEAKELHFKDTTPNADSDGITAESETKDFGIRINRVKILNKKGQEKLSKPQGTYVTIELPDPNIVSQEAYEEACHTCAKELSALSASLNTETTLVLGLGNRNITADALGPKTVDSVLVTRHLLQYMPEEIDSRLRSVCAISPGVLGITGVETAEIVKGVCERVNPTLVIAIDALCSRHISRINNTIQIADTGITPGAGIGNRRMSIDKDTLGVPVIVIGVPTVVDAATIAGDTIDKIIEELKANANGNTPLYNMLTTLAEEDRYPMIKEVLTPDHGDFVVTPKEIDSSVENIAKIIANGINIALHDGISLADVDRYK